MVLCCQKNSRTWVGSLGSSFSIFGSVVPNLSFLLTKTFYDAPKKKKKRNLGLETPGSNFRNSIPKVPNPGLLKTKNCTDNSITLQVLNLSSSLKFL